MCIFFFTKICEKCAKIFSQEWLLGFIFPYNLETICYPNKHDKFLCLYSHMYVITRGWGESSLLWVDGIRIQKIRMIWFNSCFLTLTMPSPPVISLLCSVVHVPVSRGKSCTCYSSGNWAKYITVAKVTS